MSRVLVVNAGSSSLKLGVVEPDDTVADDRHFEQWDGATDAIAELVDATRPDAVGHRVVHGGWHHTGPARLDDAVIGRIRDAVPLARLHQPRALDGIDAVRKVAPDLPAVACFDTAFHATLPEAAATYPIPSTWRREYGIRRFGFHGLSHAYVARRGAELVGRRPGELRTVSCHLGAGASLCAIEHGRSVDTTMGFTPMDGLVMATRPGAVDPGILLWLQAEQGLSVDEVADGLQRRSGLVGLAGTADMAEVMTAAAADREAQLAVAVYVHRLVGGIAAMAAAMGGLDVLAFTGGVGQHAGPLRAAAARRLGFLGVTIDDERNADVTGDVDLSTGAASVRTLVVTAREDLEIARQVREVLGDAA